MNRQKPEKQWFARGGLIKRMGPFTTQQRAFDALRTTEGEPIEGAFVWSETVRFPAKKG